MALVPLGVSISNKYTLTGPDGTVATFNDPTDPNFVGYVTEPTGLDSPEVRENGENIAGMDGGVHGAFYYGRRPITISGKMINLVSPEDRNIKITKLQQATNAMRKNAVLSWTPDGGEAVFVEVRRQQPLRIVGDWEKQFQVMVVSADPRIYSVATEAQEFELKPPVDLAAEANPTDLAGSPDGKNVYVINRSAKKITVYTRNVSTGKLTQLEVVATENEPWRIIVSKDGKDIYFTNRSSNTISHYKRNTGTGALTSKETSTAVGVEPTGLTEDFIGATIVVANFGSANLSTLKRTASTGALAAGSTFALPGTSKPINVQVSAGEAGPLVVCDYGLSKLYLYHMNSFGFISTTGAPTASTEVSITKPVGTSLSSSAFFGGSVSFIQAFGEQGAFYFGEITFKESFPWAFSAIGGPEQKYPGTSGTTKIHDVDPVTWIAADEATDTIRREQESSPQTFSTGSKPWGVCVVSSPTNSLLSMYVTNSGANTISEFVLVNEIPVRGGESIVSCVNKGDMETFPIIKLTLNGTASLISPTLTNKTTGESLSFSGTFTSGQEIVINTKNRTVTIGGSINGFSYVNNSVSNWWALIAGANEILASASGVVATVKVKIEWHNAWI